MTRKTAEQMFGKLARQIEADDRMLREERDQRMRQFEEQEARLDEPLTRREVLDALGQIASDHETQGDSLISGAFRKLIEALS